MPARLRRARFVSITDCGDDCFLASIPGRTERLSLTADMLAIWLSAPRHAYVSRSELLKAIPSEVRKAHGAAALDEAVEGLLRLGLLQSDAELIGYDRIADIYDARPPLSAAFLSIIEAHSRTAHRQRILEVGCGTGSVLQLLARLKPESLAGIDVSSEMLKVAQKRLQSLDVPWELQQARAEALPFDEGSFTMVVAVQVLHWLETAAFWNEVRRVATPENRVVLVNRSVDVDDDNPIAKHFVAQGWAPLLRQLPQTTLGVLPPFVGVHHFERFAEQMRVENAPQALEVARGYHHPYRPEPDSGPLAAALKKHKRWPMRLPCVTTVGIVEVLPPLELAPAATPARR